MFSFLRQRATFAQLADQWLQVNAPRLRPTWLDQSRRLIDGRLLPTIGHLPADKVSRRDIAVLVEGIAAPAVANQVLGVTSSIFNWGRATGRVEGPNPAEGLRKHKLQPRERTLTDAEIKAIWRAAGGVGEFGAICRLLMVCGARRQEIGSLHSREMDWEAGLIVLPPERTKAKRKHNIPLVGPMADLIPRVQPWNGVVRDGYYFGRGRYGFGGWSKAKALLDAKTGPMDPWCLHDVRRTVASRLGELGTPDEVISRVLGHAPQGVTARHYNHAQRLDEQRAALDRWAEKLARITFGV
jgi:integrase